jgi:S-adenosylmethionine:tRNA ribosyltransferase-isomerase
MVVDRAAGTVAHRSFGDVAGLLTHSDLLAINDTKVIPARLPAMRLSGGRMEILLVRKLPEAGETWLCMARASKRIRPGTEAVFPGGERCIFRAVRGEGEYAVQFSSDVALQSIMQAYGSTPLPPYIRREHGTCRDDVIRYQTVYAREPGSCAAPTAGLHFTPELLEEIDRKTAGTVRLTLHVGPGTFLPVRAENLDEHRMHEEWYELTEAAAGRINAARGHGGRLVAVGTTVARTLEHVAAIHDGIKGSSGMTGIFIKPGHRFRAVDAMITNFHLPRSTLLVLVSAFAGHELVLRAYAEAVKERYRFFSFGDAMIIV